MGDTRGPYRKVPNSTTWLYDTVVALPGPFFPTSTEMTALRAGDICPYGMTRPENVVARLAYGMS